MSDTPQMKAYKAPEITVTFESRRCLHAARCINGLPEVFDTSARPWIRPDRAPADQLAEVVRRCPSGALRYELPDGGRETPDGPTRITRTPGGQLVVRGDLSLDTQEGTHHETRAVLCGCANSQMQPYCDHSGRCGQ
ncbi:(4Fe-4S)-binding protein [Streptomyces sp. WM6386]|uniref:(4Fe-4S)-binding protein n=1 Tax=Streptomyces sp. WM6386 TaxID=1415558 RepID=UPI000619EA6D|nr:(4Fe-4S)-binding protein [Streptomyces sp. WM6386]KKD05644.1 zinc finger CDGSH type superfamily protein [Streptomyces sp. WM6386]